MTTARFTPFLLLLAVDGASQAEPLPTNAVPIRIYWSKAPGKAPLANVTFEDAAIGAVPFKRESDHFAGTRQARGSWAFHDVTLGYGGEQAPLALRTRAGTSGVRIDVALPTIAACRRDKLGQLKSVTRNASVETRLNTMLEARHLLGLGERCPLWAQKDLAEIYFVMNCSLATRTSYFRVSEEAKERLRKLARNRSTADQEIAKCDADTLGLAVKSLHEDSRRLLAESRFAAFEAANRELLTAARQPEWADAFRSQGLDDDLLRADQLKALYDQQQAASLRGQYDEALGFNAKLRALFSNGGYDKAFVEVKLDEQRLSDDRNYFESMRRPPTEEPSPQ